MTKQPLNNLSQWSVSTDDGEYVGVQSGGLYATTAWIGKVVFPDGSSLRTSTGMSLSIVDGGTY